MSTSEVAQELKSLGATFSEIAQALQSAKANFSEIGQALQFVGAKKIGQELKFIGATFSEIAQALKVLPKAAAPKPQEEVLTPPLVKASSSNPASWASRASKATASNPRTGNSGAPKLPAEVLTPPRAKAGSNHKITIELDFFIRGMGIGFKEDGFRVYSEGEGYDRRNYAEVTDRAIPHFVEFMKDRCFYGPRPKAVKVNILRYLFKEGYLSEEDMERFFPELVRFHFNIGFIEEGFQSFFGKMKTESVFILRQKDGTTIAYVEEEKQDDFRRLLKERKEIR